MSVAPTTSSEAEEIQRQMRALRVELREDVCELVGNARDLADLPTYVRAYPWLAVGAAFALGFLIVPARPVTIKPDAEGLIELAKRNRLVVKMDSPPEKKRSGIFGELLGMAAGAVLQRAMGVVSQQVARGMQAAAEPKSNGRAGATP
jgi:hypothetical protein